MVRAARTTALVVGALMLAACTGAPTPSSTPTTAAAPTSATSVALPTPTVAAPPTVATPSASPATSPPSRDSLADKAEGLASSLSAGPDQALVGADVSWPQCPAGMGIPQKRSRGAPMPLPGSRYVVVGLTNGPGFVANPCLTSQVAWVRQRRLRLAAYAVASYPSAAQLASYGPHGPYDGSTAGGALANVGYQQARSNVASARRSRLTSPVVWVDVEPVPDFDWSTDPTANAAVVVGAVRGYQDAGYRVGVYSTAALWRRVVGDLRLGLPEWRAAGQTSAAEALRRCGDGASIQGGPAVLTQWVEVGRDRDLTCPGTATALDLWFSAT